MNSKTNGTTLIINHSKIALFLLPFYFLSCNAESINNEVSNFDDITGILFNNRSNNCEDYVGQYYSQVYDINNSSLFNGELIVKSNNEKCSFTSNSIPNHDFNNGTDNFRNTPEEVPEILNIAKNPFMVQSSTPLSLKMDDAIMLNGVKLDLLAAACYGVGPDPLGQEKIGCGDEYIGNSWRYDPMSPLNSFGTDIHNAHTQPDGAYHYHGNPNALFEQTNPAEESPVIGFAADGYPIYGSYIMDNQTIRQVEPSYRMKSGSRVPIGTEEDGDFPGGNYDGMYREDYEYVEDLGDLDECNGMIYNGAYGYYVTASFPWIINCFKGEVDNSFDK